MLDRAVGRLPDPRASFRARERFSTGRDLEPEITDTTRLCNALEPLLGELCGFLRGRRCGIQSLELRLVHREAAPTRVPLRLTRPTGEFAHLAGLRQRAPGAAAARRAGAGDPPAGRCADTARGRIRGSARDESRPCRCRRAATHRAPACPSGNRGRFWTLPGSGASPGIGLARRGASVAGGEDAEPRPASEAEMRAGQRRGKAVVAARRAAVARRRRSAVLRRNARARARDRSASRAAGGTAATSGATTTSPAIRRVCGCGCSAIASRAGRWFLHGVFG